MGFRGWPAEAVDFYEGLEADNSRAYWTANKDVYDTAVHVPMEALLAELEGEFGESRIFRPYRDVRFSKDKSPYKTAIAATLARGGYVRFSAEGLGAGSGMYMMAPDQLDRYRAAVSEDAGGKALESIIAELVSRGIEVSGHGALKSAPRGYPKDHPRIDLLRYKGLVAWRDWSPGKWLATAEPRRRLAEFFRACSSMNGWLADHVGPSLAEEGRRR